MTAVASADVTKLAQALRDQSQSSAVTTQNVLMVSANVLKGEMQARVPVDTGELKNSISVRVEGGRIVIGPTADYAMYVEFGTKPHVINAKNKKALAFKMGGQTVVVKSVKHPGTKAQPFVRPAFEAWVDSLGELVAEANIQRFVREAS